MKTILILTTCIIAFSACKKKKTKTATTLTSICGGKAMTSQEAMLVGTWFLDSIYYSLDSFTWLGGSKFDYHLKKGDTAFLEYSDTCFNSQFQIAQYFASTPGNRHLDSWRIVNNIEKFTMSLGTRLATPTDLLELSKNRYAFRSLNLDLWNMHVYKRKP